jgi:hypothetical protein
MAVPVKPAVVRTFGYDSYQWAPAVANLSAPTVAEVTAVTGINLSCMLLGDQEGASAETERVTLPRLLCEPNTFDVDGETKWSHAALTVTVNTQGAALSDGKKAWEAMGDFESGFLIRRLGILSTTDWAAGQFVLVYPGTLGVKVVRTSSNDASQISVFTQSFNITATPAQIVAIAA